MSAPALYKVKHMCAMLTLPRRSFLAAGFPAVRFTEAVENFAHQVRLIFAPQTS